MSLEEKNKNKLCTAEGWMHFQIMYHKIMEISYSTSTNVGSILDDIEKIFNLSSSSNIESEKEIYSVIISVLVASL